MAKEWIESVRCLPADTSKGFDRKAYHKCLVSQALAVKKPPRSRRPVAVLTMGGPGSGKTSMVKRIIRNKDFVRSDPDAMKEELPEFALAVSKRAKNAAPMVHEESSMLADRVAEKAVKQRKNLIIDGTGKNLSNYLKVIDNLRAKGYHVTVVGADIPVAEALRRVKTRGEKTGRFVPPDVVRSIYEKVPCNVDPIAKAADEFVWFDTTTRDPKAIMEKKQGKKLRVLDAKAKRALDKKCKVQLSLGRAKPADASSSEKPSVSLDDLIKRVTNGD